ISFVTISLCRVIIIRDGAIAVDPRGDCDCASAKFMHRELDDSMFPGWFTGEPPGPPQEVFRCRQHRILVRASVLEDRSGQKVS
ncbi:MAG TPA: hypothetical protein DEB69_00400, partial [Candidatus Komeilibacteria bacterium]|nr:hypothetical protein [Candidatus Komeilibacteria bacterium]